MKFAALLKKELRICLPWLLLTILVSVLFGSLIMRSTILMQDDMIDRGYNDSYGYYGFTPSSPINKFAPLILFTALALGAILGIRQFFLPGLFKTWAFTIHRSIKPNRVIWAKFTAALITFIASLGLVWTLFYSYAAVPGRFYMPVFFRTYLEGWAYIFAGLIIYLGVALSAITTTRFYTTRLLGIAVAIVMISYLFIQTSIAGAALWLLSGASILIVQIVHTFLSREF